MAARRQREADPPQLMREFVARLASDGLPRGVVLRGEERYFREKAVDRLRAKAVESGFEVCVHDAERGNPDFKLSSLIDDLSGGGLFAAQRLVVIRNGADHLKKVGSSASDLTRAVTGFLSSPDSPGALALSLPTLRADHAVSKAVKAADGMLLDLRKLWDSPPPWNPDPRQTELVRFVLDRARDVGLRMTPDQAVYVCAATGNDLFALDDQLERMKRLPDEDLRKVVGWNAATAPWSVADQLVDGDVPRALAGVETLFQAGFQEKSGRRLVDAIALAAMLVGALSRGIRRSLVLASELERGASEADAARAVGVNGRAVGPAIARARSRSSGAWREMLDDVSSLERRAKSGVGVDANDFALFAVRWG